MEQLEITDLFSTMGVIKLKMNATLT